MTNKETTARPRPLRAWNQLRLVCGHQNRTLRRGSIGITLLPKVLGDRLWTDQSVAVHELPVDQAQVETVFIRRHDHYATSALNAFLRMSRQVSNIAARDRQLEAID